uniref:AlNc14C2G358 protein n=1 Tax=Albugo laibachii Nc14 TaxID=890382 RepID=F0VZM0_9STRA|nr:AlNc14C2G358 [Albugo laibachii Nc14]|eukprot:CCA14250.1 AlNc14C2G358 [Albugo laibachii Nc14]
MQSELRDGSIRHYCSLYAFRALGTKGWLLINRYGRKTLYNRIILSSSVHTRYDESTPQSWLYENSKQIQPSSELRCQAVDSEMMRFDFES